MRMILQSQGPIAWVFVFMFLSLGIAALATPFPFAGGCNVQVKLVGGAPVARCSGTCPPGADACAEDPYTYNGNPAIECCCGSAEGEDDQCKGSFVRMGDGSVVWACEDFCAVGDECDLIQGPGLTGAWQFVCTCKSKTAPPY